MGNGLAGNSGKENKITFRKIVTIMKWLNVFGKELFNGSARDADLVNILQQALHERGAVDPFLVHATPFVRRVDPLVDEGEQFGVGQAIGARFQVGGIFYLNGFFRWNAWWEQLYGVGPGDNNGFVIRGGFLSASTGKEQDPAAGDQRKLNNNGNY